MPALVVPLATLFILALSLLAYVALHSRHKKSSRRPLRLMGRAASVEEALKPEGFVMVDGELWRARLRAGGRAGCGVRVLVVGASGCVLEVEPLV